MATNDLVSRSPAFAQVEARLPSPEPSAAQLIVYYPAPATVDFYGMNLVRFTVAEKSYLVWGRCFTLTDVAPGTQTFEPPPHPSLSELAGFSSVDVAKPLKQSLTVEVAAGERRFFVVTVDGQIREVEREQVLTAHPMADVTQRLGPEAVP